jgi:hypothetical protein
MLQIHPNARTKPVTRVEIARSSERSGTLAKRYGVSAEPSANGASGVLPSARTAPSALIAYLGRQRRRSELWSAPCGKARISRSMT